MTTILVFILLGGFLVFAVASANVRDVQNAGFLGFLAGVCFCGLLAVTTKRT